MPDWKGIVKQIFEAGFQRVTIQLGGEILSGTTAAGADEYGLMFPVESTTIMVSPLVVNYLAVEWIWPAVP